MKRLGFIFVALWAFVACTEVPTSADDLARDAAKVVVNGIVSTRFPGVNAEPLTDCIIENATAIEIFQIAGAAVTGVDNQTTELVVEIAERPETIECATEGTIESLLDWFN